MAQTASTLFSEAREEFRVLQKKAEAVLPVIVAVAKANLLGQLGLIDRIESRVKDFESIRDNYVEDYGLPSRPLTLEQFLVDATDLLGVRVIVYRNQDVDVVSGILQACIQNVVREDKLTERDISRGARFGYRAVHLNFPFKMQGVLEDLGTPLLAEIQVRTLLSDAWARHSHKFVYKGKERPSEKMIRDFGSTAALLEKVDEEIARLGTESDAAPVTALSVELQKSQGFERVYRETGLNLSDADLLSLYLEYCVAEGKADEAGSVDEFTTEILRAWTQFRGVDFDKYGLLEPLQKLRAALFGMDNARFEWTLPLHARGRVAQIIRLAKR